APPSLEPATSLRAAAASSSSPPPWHPPPPLGSLLRTSSPYVFGRAAAPPDLHSFPTRRSSDLHRDHVPHGRVAGHHVRGGGHRRSEEHTSELQSRENLVCRLLLEKKNQARLAVAERGPQ